MGPTIDNSKGEIVIPNKKNEHVQVDIKIAKYGITKYILLSCKKNQLYIEI